MVGEDVLDLGRAGGAGGWLDQGGDGLGELGEARVGLEKCFAALGAGDAVEVGGEGQAAPAHFQEVLIEDVFRGVHQRLLYHEGPVAVEVGQLLL